MNAKPDPPFIGHTQLGIQRLEVDASDASEVAFEYAAPVRSFPAWPRKRHYSGLLWLARLHRHIEFESLGSAAPIGDGL